MSFLGKMIALLRSCRGAPDLAKTPGQAVRAFAHTFSEAASTPREHRGKRGFSVWWFFPPHRPDDFTGSPAFAGLHHAVAYPQGKPPAVETVEKSHFSKIIFEKWDRNAEKRLVFGVPHNILAIFSLLWKIFFEHFSNQGFFDSLVGWIEIESVLW